MTDDLLRLLRSQYPRWGILRDAGGNPWVALRGAHLFATADSADELRQRIRQLDAEASRSSTHRPDWSTTLQQLRRFAAYLLQLHAPQQHGNELICPRCHIDADRCEISWAAAQAGLTAEALRLIARFDTRPPPTPS